MKAFLRLFGDRKHFVINPSCREQLNEIARKEPKGFLSKWLQENPSAIDGDLPSCCEQIGWDPNTGRFYVDVETEYEIDGFRIPDKAFMNASSDFKSLPDLSHFPIGQIEAVVHYYTKGILPMGRQSAEYTTLVIYLEVCPGASCLRYMMKFRASNMHEVNKTVSAVLSGEVKFLTSWL